MFTLDPIPQKPLRVLSQGLELGLAGFRKLIILSTLLGFISLMPTLYMAEKVGDAALTPEFILQLFKQGHFLMSFLLLQLLILVITVYINALMISRIDGATRDVTRDNELVFALHKLPALLLAEILVFITIIIGFVIAALLGMLLGALAGVLFGHAAIAIVVEACIFSVMIYITIYMIFFQFAVVLDGKGPIGALNYSSTLVFRNWWRTFRVLLYFILMVAGIAILVVIPLAVFLPLLHWLPTVAAMDTGRTLLIKGVFRLIAVAIFAPFAMGILYVLYHDLKMRHSTRPAPTGVVQA